MQKARRHAQTRAPTACRRMVSGSLSTSCAECFSPFPHGTRTLSVSREYLALPDGPGGFAQDCTCPALLRVPLCPAPLRVRGYHPLWPDFPDRSARRARYNHAALLPPDGRNRPGLGYSPFARHYWGNHCCFLFLRVLRCFSSPRWPRTHVRCRPKGRRVVPFGTQAVCAYPRLFAAYHVLLRLREPRHPPCALALFSLAFTPFLTFAAAGFVPAGSALLVPICQRSKPQTSGWWRITDSNR